MEILLSKVSIIFFSFVIPFFIFVLNIGRLDKKSGRDKAYVYVYNYAISAYFIGILYLFFYTNGGTINEESLMIMFLIFPLLYLVIIVLEISYLISYWNKKYSSKDPFKVR